MLDVGTGNVYKQRSAVVCSALTTPLTTNVGEYEMAKQYFRSNYGEVNNQFDGPFDNCVCIPLTKGHHTLIDADDFDNIPDRMWRFFRGGKNNFYAYSSSYNFVAMHRVIMNPTGSYVVDHLNGNGLDNRKANMRVCTQYVNIQNRRQHTHYPKEYKYIYFDDRSQRWNIRIRVDGKIKHMGSFKDLQKAMEARDKLIG